MIQSKCIISSSGSKEWRLNGELHREDGPAIEKSSGTKMWFRNGLHHRVDGPAIEYPDGTGQWWLNGCRIYDEIVKQLMQYPDVIKAMITNSVHKS